MDVVTRSVRRLEVERAALQKEKDRGSKERLKTLVRELSELKEEADALTARWQREKDAITRVRGLKERLEQEREHEKRLERDSDYEKAAQLRYETIPDLERVSALLALS